MRSRTSLNLNIRVVIINQRKYTVFTDDAVRAGSATGRLLEGIGDIIFPRLNENGRVRFQASGDFVAAVREVCSSSLRWEGKSCPRVICWRMEVEKEVVNEVQEALTKEQLISHNLIQNKYIFCWGLPVKGQH